MPVNEDIRGDGATMSISGTAHYVTANDLITGEVVFLAADGRWVADLAAAAFFGDAEAGTARLRHAEAEADRVVGPYLAAALGQTAGSAPAHLREQVRATGPSNYFHGKQERARNV